MEARKLEQPIEQVESVKPFGTKDRLGYMFGT